MKKDTKAKNPKSAKKAEQCFCPYCDVELVATANPLCQGCGVTFYQCVECGVTVYDKEATKCPECGKPIKKGK
jgi:hypothetical protein